MLGKKDLRIGNIVKFNLNGYIRRGAVATINNHSCNLDKISCEFPTRIETVKFKNLEPVKIDEAWLTSVFLFYKDCGYYHRKDIGRCTFTFTSLLFPDNRIKVDYVHELQNLIYFLKKHAI